LAFCSPLTGQEVCCSNYGFEEMKGHFLDDKNNFTSNRMGRLDKFDAVKKDLLDNV